MFTFSDRKSIFFNSHNVSKPESSSVLTEVCPCHPGGWCEPGWVLSRGQGLQGPLACLLWAFVLMTSVPRLTHHQVTPREAFQLFSLHGNAPVRRSLIPCFFLI